MTEPGLQEQNLLGGKMAECPMCLLGYPRPHTREDWATAFPGADPEGIDVFWEESEDSE